MEKTMHGMHIHSRGMVRVTATIGMMNLTCNLFRLVQLNVELSSNGSGVSERCPNRVNYPV